MKTLSKTDISLLFRYVTVCSVCYNVICTNSKPTCYRTRNWYEKNQLVILWSNNQRNKFFHCMNLITDSLEKNKKMVVRFYALKTRYHLYLYYKSQASKSVHRDVDTVVDL